MAWGLPGPQPRRAGSGLWCPPGRGRLHLHLPCPRAVWQLRSPGELCHPQPAHSPAQPARATGTLRPELPRWADRPGRQAVALPPLLLQILLQRPQETRGRGALGLPRVAELSRSRAADGRKRDRDTERPRQTDRGRETEGQSQREGSQRMRSPEERVRERKVGALEGEEEGWGAGSRRGAESQRGPGVAWGPRCYSGWRGAAWEEEAIC